MTAPTRPRESKKVAEPQVIYAKNGNGNGSDWTQKYGSILQTVIVMSIPFTALWIGAISPLIGNQEKLLTTREHDEYRRSVDKRLEYVDAELLRLRSVSATKEDVARTEVSDSTRVTAIGGRIMKIEDELHGSANIGKSVDRIQEHLNEIDKRILGVVKGGTVTP